MDLNGRDVFERVTLLSQSSSSNDTVATRRTPHRHADPHNVLPHTFASLDCLSVRDNQVHTPVNRPGDAVQNPGASPRPVGWPYRCCVGEELIEVREVVTR